ncbi:MAG: ribonuclease PH [candidate division WOR-3 bacterium]|nr:ribonuclease PH [candidate division WOR-3 bacterium]MCX7757979.1 ribonuclease PH [candidate division WOR-3 bacterium]MDW7987215.1 ribonuclease PH [candidate division WOR-3 bacterium]
MFKRTDGRKPQEIRKFSFTLDYLKYPWGSCLATAGNTIVLCSATFQKKVPPFLLGTAKGWITAEYSLLPCSTVERTNREAVTGRQTGRTQEIQRFLGRALRAVCDLSKLGENQIIIDCDVLQADGGTRTVALNGAFLALARCIDKLLSQKIILENPIREHLGAISVGYVANNILLDLTYEEDSNAQVDMNVVMTESGRLVELQATAETSPISKTKFYKMLTLAEKAINDIIKVQKRILAKTK